MLSGNTLYSIRVLGSGRFGMIAPACVRQNDKCASFPGNILFVPMLHRMYTIQVMYVV